MIEHYQIFKEKLKEVKFKDMKTQQLEKLFSRNY
jgi:hypothetical protein